LTDNSLQSADKDQRKSPAEAEKPHDSVKNSIRTALYNKCACLCPLVWFQTALYWIIGHFLPPYATWLCHSMSSVCPSV